MAARRGRWSLCPPVGAAGIAALVLGTGCTGLRIDPRPPRIALAEVQRQGVYLRAAALRERELGWEIFDEDLPSLGIAVLWVEWENRRNSPVDLSGCRWRLRLGTREERALKAREVLAAYYRARRLRFYTAKGDQDAHSALESRMLHGTVLAPGTRLSGYLFFKSARGESAGSPVLAVHDLKLDAHTRLNIELPLPYAGP